MFAVAGIRLVPVFLEDVKVTSVLKSVKAEFDGNKSASVGEIKKSIRKRFDVDSISAMSAKDVKVTRTGSGYAIDASYEQRAPFIGNVGFVANFAHVVEITP